MSEKLNEYVSDQDIAAPPRLTEADFYALLSDALKAICTMRELVGEVILPAEVGHDWFDAGKALADCLRNSTDPIHYEWVHQFLKIENRYISLEASKIFKVGDWVTYTGEHKGCSQVFEGTYCDYQPFSYLDDFDITHYRLATLEEIMEAKNK